MNICFSTTTDVRTKKLPDFLPSLWVPTSKSYLINYLASLTSTWVNEVSPVLRTAQPHSNLWGESILKNYSAFLTLRRRVQSFDCLAYHHFCNESTGHKGHGLPSLPGARIGRQVIARLPSCAWKLISMLISYMVEYISCQRRGPCSHLQPRPNSALASYIVKPISCQSRVPWS